MTRRDHLREWAKEVIKDGMTRGAIRRGDSAPDVIEWILRAAASDLQADLAAILVEVGIPVASGLAAALFGNLIEGALRKALSGTKR